MTGIILVNVGTPASPEKKDVKRFIGHMLSDPLVTGKAEWQSILLAKNIIAPLSASGSGEKYKLIWRKDEPKISPIQYYSEKLAQALELASNIPVEVTMRYGEPDINSAVYALKKRYPQLLELVIFPLYPQYAQSTTQTAIEHIKRYFDKYSHSFRLKFIDPYYNHPAYIKALAKSALPYLQDIDRLIFSYHSLPTNQIEAAGKNGINFDYIYQVKETNRLFCEEVGFDLLRTSLVFSSQRGDNWMKPFLNTEIKELPSQGFKKVAVMAPGFPIDNMETLYDMDIEARKLFMDNGGEKFIFIPSLNDSELWVKAICQIILA